jgi:hypothetical protein
MWAVTAIGISTLPQRRWTALVIFVGTMSVAAVLLSMLSMLSVTVGITKANLGSVDPARAIVRSRGDTFYDYGSGISRNGLDTILDAPGIAKQPGGAPFADGEFSDGASLLESYLVGDADTIMAATRRTGFGAVVVRLQDRNAFAAFERWLRSNPALTVEAERQSEFGTVKNMYAAVRARTREIGTLRALGYASAPVAVSVLTESVLVSLAGAIVGACIAWLVFDDRESYIHEVVRLRVSAELFALGLLWAIGVALLGRALPSAAGRAHPGGRSPGRRLSVHCFFCGLA